MTTEPTLGEVARTLDRIESEFSRRFADLAQSVSLMITRDLYEAHRAAMQDDITDLRTQLTREADRRAADRRMVHGAFITASLSILVTVVGAALVIAFRLS